jgi:hypothetical protein
VNHLVNSPTTLGVLIGLGFGVLSRIHLLRTDYRQFPTVPHGKIIHIALGVIAAGLGSVAVPALLNKDYTAITFLSLAAQQFREVRNMERETLGKIDSMELVPRGAVYIEGIAMVFEGRNYLVIFTSLVTTLASMLLAWYWGVVTGIAALVVAHRFMSGKTLKRIADVEPAEVVVKGPDLYVGDIYIMNIGLKDSQDKVARYGLGLIVRPKNKDCRVTLANLGQRQAILHDLSTILGVYRDDGEPSLVPQAKLDMEDGRLGVFIPTRDRDYAKAIEAVNNVPVLESAVRMPSESKAQYAKGGE